jgi:hypothetical protein
MKPEPIHAPNRVSSEQVMAGFATMQAAGAVLKVTEQANTTRTDKRRWVVTLPGATVIVLTPSQAWAFLLGWSASAVTR